MKAITLTAHDDAGVLSLPDPLPDLVLADVPDPRPAADQILVEVRAAGVDPADLIRPPLIQHSVVPGGEVAGVVVARGPDVTGFVVGDEVYACAERGYAERVVVAERDAAHKPAALSFVEAAAVPRAALTALHALRAAGTGEGDVVLVHDAAGGVGHFAVQIARALGAERVLGTAAVADHDFLRELGAEPVDRPEGPVDVALDLRGGDTTADALRQVRDPARAVSTVDGAAIEHGGGRFVPPVSAATPGTGAEGLRWLADLADLGLLRVSLHRELPLAEVADAHRLVGSGRVRGKVVLTP